MNLLVLRQKKFNSLLIFSFFFLIYIASNGGHVDETDGIYSFLVTENLALNGSPSLNSDSPSIDEFNVDINDYIKTTHWKIISGKFYEKFPTYDSPGREEFLKTYMDDVDYNNFFGPTYLVLPVLGTPFYLFAKLIDFPVIHFVPLFLNSMIVAISATMIFLVGRDIFNSEKTGFVLSLIFGLTSFMWPYITSMYSNPLGIMFLLISLFFIIQRRPGVSFPFLGGICLGMSFLAHPFMLQIVPGFLIFGGIEYRKNKKKLFAFIIGFLILVLVQAYVNYERFGSIESFGFEGGNRVMENSIGEITYIVDNSDEMFSGIYGYLFSPGRSIFLYFPISLLAPIGLYYLYKKNKALAILLIYWICAPFLYFATSPNWDFNPHWGPHRYLLVMIPPLTLSVGSIISQYWSSIRLKVGIILTSVTGFIVNLLGTIVWVMYAYSLGWGIEGVWKVKDKTEVFTWNPSFSGPVQSLKVLLIDYVGKMQVSPNDTSYMRLGLHGCPVDNYIFCIYGIFPLILLGIAIVIIGYFIIRTTSKNILEI